MHARSTKAKKQLWSFFPLNLWSDMKILQVELGYDDVTKNPCCHTIVYSSAASCHTKSVAIHPAVELAITE